MTGDAYEPSFAEILLDQLCGLAEADDAGKICAEVFTFAVLPSVNGDGKAGDCLLALGAVSDVRIPCQSSDQLDSIHAAPPSRKAGSLPERLR